MKHELLKVYANMENLQANMENLQAGKPMENFPSQALGLVAMPGRVPQAGDGGS